MDERNSEEFGTLTERPDNISASVPDGDRAARDYDLNERKMEKFSREIEAKSAEGKKAKNRKWWIQTSLLLILIIASVVLLFGVTTLVEGQGMKSFQAMLRDVDWSAFGVLLAVVVLYIFFESAKYAYLLKISTKKFYPRVALKVMFLGKYYDGITPLGTGGQPFQIYYLHKKNSIPAGVATAVPLVKYTVSTIVFCMMAVVVFIFAPKFLPGGWGDTTLLVVAWVSMIANFSIPVLMVCCSLFPRFGKKLIAGIIHVLWKMKIVKHRYRVMHKYVYEVREYRNALKMILRKWWHYLPLAFIALCAAVCSFSIPFFAVVAIADVTPNLDLFMQMYCLSIISFYSSSLIPTPGGTGALEGAAAIIFSTVLLTQPGVSGVIGWVILVWRLLSYYIYIFTGVGINIFEIIRSAVRNRRAVKANS